MNVSAQELILLVDDEERMLESLRNLMVTSGYNVITAVDGNDAVAKLNEHSIDLMLLDLQMPGFTGHQVMDYVEDHGIETTVIVVSGETSFDAVSQVLRRRAYDYIKKPYAPDELLQTVENAVKMRRLEVEHGEIRERLEESEKLHRYLINNSPDIIYMLDHQGNFSFVNDQTLSLLGYEKEELVDNHYTDIVHYEDVEQANYVFGERRARGDRATRTVELRFKCKDGDRAPRYFETNTLPISLAVEDVTADDELVGIYGVARDITDRKEAERTINFQAYHDLLTHLPNRSLFKDRLNLAIAQARRSNQRLAVMFLDLDRFKIVNDTLGHLCGDELLQAVSARLQECLREGDTLARFGGDEFTLLLPQIYGTEDAEAIARKIIDKIKEPFYIDNHEIYVTISIGIAMYPHDGITMDNLVRNADIAMYHIKGRGKNDYQFYNDSMNEVSVKRLSLEGDLHRALETDQFRLHFQPQVDVVSGQIVAVEALIRWQHPELGLISPTEFVAVAEETGLIVPIGTWVMETACKTLKAWHDEGFNGLRMAVNLSALQVEHKTFVDVITQVLSKYQLSGHHLEVEITENLIMQDMENAINKLAELSSMGIKIAVDDFGTGYSSLSYLQKLPIDTIKIDRSFVHEIQSVEDETPIVDAIIAMASGLKLNLIAEGVETKAQMEYLRQRGCSEMQGYFYGPPLPPDRIKRMLRERPFDNLMMSNAV